MTNFISRKDFKPTIGHRVCSEHFPGGKKTYMNNVPTVTPKTANAKPLVERSTHRARNRVTVESTETEIQDQMEGEEILQGLLMNAESELMEAATVREEGNKEDLSQAKRIEQLENENSKLRTENEQLKGENSLLHDKLTKQNSCNAFSVENFKEDDKLFKFYTGLPDYKTFKAVFRSFGPAVNKLVYHDSGTNPGKLVTPEYNKRGPKRTLTPEQEFFLVLVRLRLGLLIEDLANRASISVQHVSRICITWFDFLHNILRMLPVWPTRACIDETMPKCFRETYPTTRVVIDCTEIFIEKACSVRSQSVTYSNYKHHNTAKGLVGITPAGQCHLSLTYILAGQVTSRHHQTVEFRSCWRVETQ